MCYNADVKAHDSPHHVVREFNLVSVGSEAEQVRRKQRIKTEITTMSPTMIQGRRLSIDGARAGAGVSARAAIANIDVDDFCLGRVCLVDFDLVKCGGNLSIEVIDKCLH